MFVPVNNVCVWGIFLTFLSGAFFLLDIRIKDYGAKYLCRLNVRDFVEKLSTVLNFVSFFEFFKCFFITCNLYSNKIKKFN